MKKPRYLVWLSLLMLWMLPVHAQLAPDALVKETSEKVLAALDANKARYEKEPELVYQLVNDIVLPHMDFKAMSKLALGKFWREANDTQQAEFVDAFKIMLVRTYSKSLTQYSGQTIEYKPYQPPAAGKRTVVVNTEIKQSSGPAIPIDYRLYTKGGIWKVYDIKIDGISLVTNYRNSFASDIRKVGMDGLIEKLQAKYNKESA